MTRKAKRATKFPLLVYRRLYQMWFWPSLLVSASTTALMVWNPPLISEIRWVFLPATLVGALLMVYSFVARHSAWVQAHPRGLYVQVPFYRLVVSYGRLNVVRTAPFKAHFPPESLSWTQRQFSAKLYGRTCILAELKGFPIPKRLLSMLLNRFLLPTRAIGLAFLVDDWLQLSNEIEGARSEWVNRRFSRREPRTVERILRR